MQISTIEPNPDKPQKEIVGHDEIYCSSCNKHLLDIILIEEEIPSQLINLDAQCLCGDTSWKYKYPKSGYRVAPANGLIISDINDLEISITFILSKE